MGEKSKIEAELDFLAALEAGEVVTQMTLSKRIAVSVGLVNALLKRAMHKGYVKTSVAPYKRYAYYLTPNGFSEKSRLVAEYLESSLDFFRRARHEYLELFKRASDSGINRIVFAGSGELVEIALGAARDAEVDVASLFDPASTKSRVYGLDVVKSFDQITAVEAVAITDTSAPQDMFGQLSKHMPESNIFTPPFLRITRGSLDFKPKVSRG